MTKLMQPKIIVGEFSTRILPSYESNYSEKGELTSSYQNGWYDDVIASKYEAIKRTIPVMEKYLEALGVIEIPNDHHVHWRIYRLLMDGEGKQLGWVSNKGIYIKRFKSVEQIDEFETRRLLDELTSIGVKLKGELYNKYALHKNVRSLADQNPPWEEVWSNQGGYGWSTKIHCGIKTTIVVKSISLKQAANRDTETVYCLCVKTKKWVAKAG